jgi:hypothetical protein
MICSPPFLLAATLRWVTLPNRSTASQYCMRHCPSGKIRSIIVIMPMFCMGAR